MEQKPRPRGADVIRQEFADARKKEQERSQRSDVGASPLPEGAYPFRREELYLLNPLRSELDGQLRKTCALFSTLTEDERTSFRRRISLEGFYLLLNFARRASVFALREQSRDILNDGLVSIAMIEADRMDFRDIVDTLSLLYHSSTRIGVDPARVFGHAAKLAEPHAAQLIAGFARRAAGDKDILQSWGFSEVKTAMGIGFVHSDFCVYNPTVDLLDAAIRIVRVVEQDKYEAVLVAIASQLPGAWLRETVGPELDILLNDIRACVAVSAKTKEEYLPRAERQQPSTLRTGLTIFLAELNQPASAGRLSRLTESGRVEGDCVLGVSSGRLFCLMVAPSCYGGVESFRGRSSLFRFELPVREVLAQSYQSGNGQM